MTNIITDTELEAVLAGLMRTNERLEKVNNAVKVLQCLRAADSVSHIRTMLIPDTGAGYMTNPAADYIARAGEKFAAQIIGAARAEAQAVVDEYMAQQEART